MPIALSNVEDLVPSSALPSDVDAIVTKVIAAPLDWGKVFTTDWKYDNLPFSLGFYIHYSPDKDEDFEPFFSAIDATGWGKLQYYIASTAEIDHKSLVSDIDYPGNPVAQEGLDMDLMSQALEQIWNSVKGDLKLYHQALMDKYGGV